LSIVVLLDGRLDVVEQATRGLDAWKLTDSQLAAIDAVRASCHATGVHGVLSPIQQAEREDTIARWLKEHDVDEDVAGPLAETAVTLDALDRIAQVVSGPPLGQMVRMSESWSCLLTRRQYCAGLCRRRSAAT
jgi:hypothetical protein